MAVLAVLPVHAIYAGFVLRESLVALTSILAVWTLTEVWHADQLRRGDPGRWAVAAGVCGGLAVLARTTALALLGGRGAVRPVRARPRRFGPLMLWARPSPPSCAALGMGHPPGIRNAFLFVYELLRIQLLVDSPPLREGQHVAVAVLHAGEPARDRAGEDQVAADHRRLLDHDRGAADRCWASAGGCRSAKRAGTRHRPAGRDDLRGLRAGDAQEHRRRDAGRPARALLHAGLRADAAGARSRASSNGWTLALGAGVVPWLAATYCALVWADPTWAYDASWLVKRYQLHWPALSRRASGSRRIRTRSRPRPGS